MTPDIQNESHPLNKELVEYLKSVSTEGIKNAAHGFSSMIGRNIDVTELMLRTVPILKIPAIVAGPETDAVGVYLRFEGELQGQIMMIIPYAKALELADLLMGLEAGTTKSLDSLERSALGELGNLCGSFYLNSISEAVGASFRPTPPAVVVDMVGAILDIVIATAGAVSDNVLIMHANLLDGARCVETDFWVIPDTLALQSLIKQRLGA